MLSLIRGDLVGGSNRQKHIQQTGRSGGRIQGYIQSHPADGLRVGVVEGIVGIGNGIPSTPTFLSGRFVPASSNNGEERLEGMHAWATTLLGEQAFRGSHSARARQIKASRTGEPDAQDIRSTCVRICTNYDMSPRGRGSRWGGAGVLPPGAGDDRRAMQGIGGRRRGGRDEDIEAARVGCQDVC